MKFIITRNYLDQTLNVISKGIANKTPMKILTGIYIKAEDNKLTFISTNKEISIRKVLEPNADLEILETGDCVVPGKLFVDIVKKIDDGRIEFSIFDSNTAKIISKNSNFTLTTFECMVFPPINFDVTGPNIRIACKDLRKTVSQTSFACGVNESRLILTSLNVAVDNTGLTVIGCDGLRLSKKIDESIKSSSPIKVNIPAKAIEEFCKIIQDTTDEVEIVFANNVALFKIDGISFVTRLIEGVYKDTQAIFERPKTLEVVFNRQELMRAVDRASLFISDFDLNFVKLTFNAASKDVILASNSTESGRVEVNLSTLEINPASNMLVAFSSRNLLDALKAFEGEYVKIAFSGEIRPAVLTSTEDSSLSQVLFLPRAL